MVSALLILILVAAAANLAVMRQASVKLDKMASEYTRGRPLACSAIPIKLVAEDPACANKLIEAMNITNVHILSNESVGSRFERDLTSMAERHGIRRVHGIPIAVRRIGG